MNSSDIKNNEKEISRPGTSIFRRRESKVGGVLLGLLIAVLGFAGTKAVEIYDTVNASKIREIATEKAIVKATTTIESLDLKISRALVQLGVLESITQEHSRRLQAIEEWMEATRLDRWTNEDAAKESASIHNRLDSLKELISAAFEKANAALVRVIGVESVLKRMQDKIDEIDKRENEGAI